MLKQKRSYKELKLKFHPNSISSVETVGSKLSSRKVFMGIWNKIENFWIDFGMVNSIHGSRLKFDILLNFFYTGDLYTATVNNGTTSLSLAQHMRFWKCDKMRQYKLGQANRGTPYFSKLLILSLAYEPYTVGQPHVVGQTCQIILPENKHFPLVFPVLIFLLSNFGLI